MAQFQELLKTIQENTVRLLLLTSFCAKLLIRVTFLGILSRTLIG